MRNKVCVGFLILFAFRLGRSISEKSTTRNFMLTKLKSCVVFKGEVDIIHSSMLIKECHEILKSTKTSIYGALRCRDYVDWWDI